MHAPRNPARSRTVVASPSRWLARWLPARWLARASLALALAASACAPAGYYVEYDNVETELPPPPPRAEAVPGAPGPDYVWLPGYWYWTGQNYLWRPGAWDLPPAPHHVWVRSGWVRNGRTYRYIPGRWAPPNRVPPHHYWGQRPRPIR